MAYDHDESAPANDAIVADFPSNERDHRAAVHDGFEIDHYEADGLHRKATLVEQAADPATVANQGYLYTKNDAAGSGKTELYWMDEDGTVLQLTRAGAWIYDDDDSGRVDVTGDEMTGDLDMSNAEILLDNVKAIQGDQAATGGYVDMLQRNASDQVELGSATTESVIKCDDASGAVVNYGGGDQIIRHEGNSVAFTESFTSSEQTVGNGDYGSEAHNLSGIPKFWVAVLRCKVVDAGYAVGDEVSITPLMYRTDTPAIVYEFNPQIWWDDDYLYWVVGGNGCMLWNVTTGAYQSVDEADWALVVRAWY